MGGGEVERFGFLTDVYRPVVYNIPMFCDAATKSSPITSIITKQVNTHHTAEYTVFVFV
jgi:hypothetical protein